MFNAEAERSRAPLRWWQACGVLAQDAMFAAGFTVLGFLPALAANGLLLGKSPVHRAGLLAVLLALAQCLPLAGRRRWPALCLAIVACAFAAYQLLGYQSSFTSEGLLLALYAAGAYEITFRRELAVGATASFVVLAIALEGVGAQERPVDYVVFYLALAACWGAGTLVRARQARRVDEARSHPVTPAQSGREDEGRRRAA